MDYLLNSTPIPEWLLKPRWVLNLIINGLPSKLKRLLTWKKTECYVLNLIINGLPSKLPKYLFRHLLPIYLLF